MQLENDRGFLSSFCSLFVLSFSFHVVYTLRFCFPFVFAFFFVLFFSFSLFLVSCFPCVPFLSGPAQAAAEAQFTFVEIL